MKTIAMALALSLGVTTASAATMPSDAAIAAAKQKITSILYDPAPVFPSVRFVTRDSVGYYCGYVNARNRFGGYTGEKPFVVIASASGELSLSAEVIDDSPDTLGYQRKLNYLRQYCAADPNPVELKF